MAKQDTTQQEGESQKTFPNKMGRIVLLALEEVMGRNGINAILNLARLQNRIGDYPPNDFERRFTFDELGRLLQALDEMYGPRSGRGLARRAGRASFRYGIKDYGPILGLADLAFRVLPTRMRIKVGLEVLAETFNRFTDQRVQLLEEDQYIHWVVEQCGVCWGRHSGEPCCHLLVGVLEEGLYWVSGGKTFYVEEISCIARGDEACEVLIGTSQLE
jgi:predicted hydrocarbon binding protein